MKIKLGHILYGLLVIGTLIAVFYGFSIKTQQPTQDTGETKISYIKGHILTVEGNKELVVELLDNSKKIVKIQPDTTMVHDVYKKGQEVTVYQSQNPDNTLTYDIADYYHSDGLFIVLVIFCILAIVMAKKKGFNSILSVLVSLSLFYFFYLNFIKAGYNPLTFGLIYVAISTFLTVPLIHGFNKKSLSALIAINLGFILSLAITYALVRIIQVGNTPSDEFRTLFIQHGDIQIFEILVFSIFFGAVGALIDISVTISSAIYEAFKTHSHTSFIDAYKMGLEVGKDILGSMINTILSAYLASSLPFFILLSIDKFGNLNELLNYDFIALELTRTFVGAISMTVLIPFTAVVCAYLTSKSSQLHKRIE